MNENDNKNKENKGFISIFIASFTTIFIAELGDKTQIATLMLSAESGSPYLVFISSAFALVCSSVVGVLIGKWLSSKVSSEKFSFATGILMIFISIWIGYTVLNMYF